jgi:dUTP pyrophosphatase
LYSDYRGEIGVVMVNHGETDFQIKNGDKIAQMLIERNSRPTVVEVDDLDKTERDSAGWGSTGTVASEK